MPTNENLPQNDPGSGANPKAPAEWTIMIYMAGDNNLSDDCVNALTKLQDIHTGDAIHVIAQFDPADTRVGSQRLVINLDEKHTGTATAVSKPNSPSKLAKDHVKIEEGSIKYGGIGRTISGQLDPGETDTADPKTLFDFISWCSEAYKANHYMLILAGHSSGIEQGFLLKDEHPAHSMSLDGLMKVLSEVALKGPKKLGIKLDILGMDSCLMSMIEICYELRGLVDVFVSSQSNTPDPGWPYGDIVDALWNQSQGKINAEKFAPMIVNRYVNSYVENAVNSGLATDLAAVKVDASEAVAATIKEFGSVLRSKLVKGDPSDAVAASFKKFGDELTSKLEEVKGNASEAVAASIKELRSELASATFNMALIHAHWEAQSYNGERFVDLRDFCDLTQSYCQDEAVTKAAENVQQAMKAMMLASCFCGIDYQYSNGLSIYFPWSTIFSYYANLSFAKASDWFTFLSEYVEKTRRPPRGGDAPGPSNRFLVFRRDPPYGHGPEAPASSMRNPPRKWSKNGISDCIEQKEELSKFFESFQ